MRDRHDKQRHSYPSARSDRLPDHSTGGSFLENDAVAHENHPVGDLTRKSDLMSDDDHRHAFGRKVAHHTKDFADQTRDRVPTLPRRTASPARV
jgi:hypothetical protein